MTQRWYSVGIETAGPKYEAERLERLAEVMAEAYPEASPVVGWGGLAGGPSVQMAVMAPHPADAAAAAIEDFRKALVELGITNLDVESVEVVTEEYQERQLAQEPAGFAGVTEVAKLLGVSRQRVSELRGRPGFPEPIAELAAGPVWDLATLKRFVEEWPRRPGRPRKQAKSA